MNRQNRFLAFFSHPSRIALAYSLAAFLAAVVLLAQADKLLEERFATIEREQVASQVDTLGNSLTLAVSEKTALVSGLWAFIKAESLHDSSHSFFADEIVVYSELLYNSTRGIRNIAVAPGGVMEYVYPYEENKSVLGYEPASDARPYVRAEVQRALESGEVVLSLPYELLQGGQGVIARQAVFVGGEYWGLANVVVDLPTLLAEAGIDPPPDGLELALKDQSGRVFWGSESVFEGSPVTHASALPEGSWTLVAIPTGGWLARFQALRWVPRILGALLALSVPLIVYFSVNRWQQLSLLVEQRTRSLRRSEEKYHSTLRSMHDLVFVLDEENRFIAAHAQRDQLLYAPEGFIGKTVADVMPEAIAVQFAAAREELEENGVGDIEYELDMPDGVHWYTARLTRMMENDVYTGLVIVVRDISQRRQAELSLQDTLARLEEMVAERTRALEDAQERLIRKERLAVLGELAGGVGHELRNPLGVISNAVYYLKMTSTEMDEKSREYLDLIQSNTENAAHIVNGLLDFARGGTPDRAVTSIPELISSLFDQFPVPENITVRVDLAEDLPSVIFDPRQLKHVLGNLVQNAYQAMLSGGQLSIVARGEAAGEEQEPTRYDKVSILIIDSGTGIQPDHLSRIFEPLFTTKVSGIGLGLSISKKLIEANGGRIDVESNAGEGTTIRLILPVSEV